MQIINTVSWAGHDFSFSPGDTIDLPDEIALARIEAGLADALPAAKKAPAKKAEAADPK